MLVANVGVKINWRQEVSPTSKTVRFSNPKKRHACWVILELVCLKNIKRHQHELCVQHCILVNQFIAQIYKISAKFTWLTYRRLSIVRFWMQQTLICSFCNSHFVVTENVDSCWHSLAVNIRFKASIQTCSNIWLTTGNLNWVHFWNFDFFWNSKSDWSACDLWCTKILWCIKLTRLYTLLF